MAKAPTYKQKIKKKVRTMVLHRAVELLTSKRSTAIVLNGARVRQTLDYALKVLNNRSYTADANREFDAWLPLHRRLVGRRRPSDLRVLYLCGPEPLNDLEVLIEVGVDPHNVWAVESSHEEFRLATEQIRDSSLPVKIYRGALAEFLTFTSEQFDIIYIDGCAPFASGKPNSLHAILQLLLHQRLSPLGVLVTNFAELDPSLSWYPDALASYFRFRYNDAPRAMFKADIDPALAEHDHELMLRAVRKDPEPYYSDFITRLIADLARSAVPNCRALAFSGIAATHLAPPEKQKEAIKKAREIPKNFVSWEEYIWDLGDFHMNPAGYPLLSFYDNLHARIPDSPLWRQLAQIKLGNHSLYEAGRLAEMVENCIEGHWDVLSDVLRDAIRLGWFDRDDHFSCDVPLPNLLVNSYLGICGAPSFPNPGASLRLRYRAKATTMYTDLMVLDRCRSFYDWFPMPQVAEARFRSVGFQILARCMIDQIGWADWKAKSHPFSGGAVAGMREIPASFPRDFSARQDIA